MGGGRACAGGPCLPGCAFMAWLPACELPATGGKALPRPASAQILLGDQIMLSVLCSAARCAVQLIFMAPHERILELRPQAEALFAGRASLTMAIKGMLEVGCWLAGCG